MDYKEFFEQIVLFDTYIEFRIMDMRTKPAHVFSLFAENIQQVETIFKQYDVPPYVIYYGINSRKTKGIFDRDVESRRLFFFDIEHEGTKPPLSDEKYFSELSLTADYIIEELFKRYNIKPVALVTSGRGLHLYYGCNPRLVSDKLTSDGVKFSYKFKSWFKWIKKELHTERPVEHIKFLDGMQNLSRIASCVGSHHNKYPEKPERKVLFSNVSNFTDISVFLDMFVSPVKVYKEVIIEKGKNRLYNEKTIFNAPEFKVFELKIPTTGGFGINNYLRLALNLLMRKYNIQNKDEVAQRIEALGYPYKPFEEITDSEYSYNHSILNNWVMQHWEFCLEKNFLLPYPIPYSKSFRYRTKRNFVVDDQCIGLKTPTNIIDYIKKWNNKYCKKINGTEIFYIDDMKENVMRGIENPKLKEWVEKNKFLDKVKLVK